MTMPGSRRVDDGGPMTAMRVAAALLAVYVVVLVQSTVVSRMPLPGGRPNLVLLFVIAVGLAAGTTPGLLVGFGAGVVIDLMSDHPVGVLGLCFALGGFAAGMLTDSGSRSALRSLLWVVLIATCVQLLYAALLLLLGPRGGGVLHEIPGTVGYDALLAPFVLPVVLAVERRLRSAR